MDLSCDLSIELTATTTTTTKKFKIIVLAFKNCDSARENNKGYKKEGRGDIYGAH